MTEFLRPGGAGQFVRDQLVGGVRVGNAEQRLGEAHHSNAFVATEVVRLQEGVKTRRLVRANALYERTSGRRRLS